MNIYDYLTQDLYSLDTQDTASVSTIQQAQSTGTETYSETLVSGEVDGYISFSGGFIQSYNFVTGTTGWRLSADGSFEGSSGTFRGSITGASGTFTGTITATTGTIGGFDIGSDYIRDAANSFGLASTVTGGDDVRFWAGDTFANRETALFRITEGGQFTAVGGMILTIKSQTCFETAARFDVSDVGGTGAINFDANGVGLGTGPTGTSYASLEWIPNGNNGLSSGISTCSFSVDLNQVDIASGTGSMYLGIGLLAITGTAINFTAAHI